MAMRSSANVAAALFRNVCWLPEFRSHDSIPGAEPVHHAVSQRIYRAWQPASEESEAMGLQPAEHGRTPWLAISPDRILSATTDDLDWLGELSAVGSSMVTLAPECVPTGFVKTLVGNGIRVSVGHSEADADTLTRAIDDGLSGVTHLFNAMPAMSARQPGIVGVALTDQRLTAGIILDGIHVDPLVAQAAFSAKNRSNIALVSDAMPTVGTEQDHFELMGRQIQLRYGRLVSESGTLAGAHLDLASAVKNAVTLVGISLDDALRAASLVPARFLGIEHRRGTLSAGARADIVALTTNLDVLTTWVAGKPPE